MEARHLDNPARFRPALLWELPLGLASWIVYRLVRLAVGLRLLWSARRRGERELLPWRVLSKDLLARRGLLEQIVIGPRWNTAAVNTASGPYRVAGRVEVDLAALDAAAGHWSLLVYAVAPFWQGARVPLARHVNRRTADRSGTRLVLGLAHGRYWLSVRYYGPAPRLTLPRVWVDGAATVEPLAVAAPDVEDFYRDLARRTTPFLTLLQYHAWAFVKWRRLLSARFVRRMLLPVGDPETEFQYGTLAPGESLVLSRLPRETDAGEASLVFLTVYNRASLPVLWLAVPPGEWTSEPFPFPTLYLVRVVRPSSAAAQEPVTSSVIEGSRAGARK
jgi:hypothetical protein